VGQEAVIAGYSGYDGGKAVWKASDEMKAGLTAGALPGVTHLHEGGEHGVYECDWLAVECEYGADVAGYKIFAGRVSGTHDTPIDVGNVTEATYTIDAPGQWYFIIKCYDTSGNLSSPRQLDLEKLHFCSAIFSRHDMTHVADDSTRQGRSYNNLGYSVKHFFGYLPYGITRFFLPKMLLY
jgi:hypothetical protein